MDARGIPRAQTGVGQLERYRDLAAGFYEAGRRGVNGKRQRVRRRWSTAAPNRRRQDGGKKEIGELANW